MGRHLFRPCQPFLGPLASILVFTGGEAFQALSISAPSATRLVFYAIFFHFQEKHFMKNIFVQRLRSKALDLQGESFFSVFFSFCVQIKYECSEHSRISEVTFWFWFGLGQCRSVRLSAFYHMAKQYSMGVNTQATDEKTEQCSPVSSSCTHTAAPDTTPELLDQFLLRTTQIHFLIRNSAKYWQKTDAVG